VERLGAGSPAYMAYADDLAFMYTDKVYLQLISGKLREWEQITSMVVSSEKSGIITTGRNYRKEVKEGITKRCDKPYKYLGSSVMARYSGRGIPL